MPSDFRMLCQEGQDFETHIEVEWTEPCLVVRATNVNEAGPSTTVEREYCVPEHPSLAIGLILLVLFGERRKVEVGNRGEVDPRSVDPDPARAVHP